MTDDHCIFCKIATHQAESIMVYEDDELMIFHDIRPKAPIHLLIAPKQHIESLNGITVEHADLLGRLLLKAVAVARDHGIDQSGYKLVTNVGDDGGQIIPHLHFHLVGGKPVSMIV